MNCVCVQNDEHVPCCSYNGVINQIQLDKVASGMINVALMLVTTLLKQLTCSIHFEIVYSIKPQNFLLH